LRDRLEKALDLILTVEDAVRLDAQLLLHDKAAAMYVLMELVACSKGVRRKVEANEGVDTLLLLRRHSHGCGAFLSTRQPQPL
jgi:hypothetical protein